MKTILIVNQKGGSGKTLIADTLARAFELDQVNMNYIDLDQQGGAMHDNHISEDAKIQIIDTPGALQKELKEWIEDADFVIIPTLTSTSDLPPLENTLEIYDICKTKPPLLVVFNRWDHTNNTKEFISAFETVHPDISTAVLSDTVAFRDGFKKGLSIEQYRPRCKAAQQMREIYAIVKHELKIKEGYR